MVSQKKLELLKWSQARTSNFFEGHCKYDTTMMKVLGTFLVLSKLSTKLMKVGKKVLVKNIIALVEKQNTNMKLYLKSYLRI